MESNQKLKSGMVIYDKKGLDTIRLVKREVMAGDNIYWKLEIILDPNKIWRNDLVWLESQIIEYLENNEAKILYAYDTPLWKVLNNNEDINE